MRTMLLQVAGFHSCPHLFFYMMVPEWLPGDEFAAVCRVSLSLEDEPGEVNVVSGPGEYELSWRRCVTHFARPSFLS